MGVRFSSLRFLDEGDSKAAALVWMGWKPRMLLEEEGMEEGMAEEEVAGLAVMDIQASTTWFTVRPGDGLVSRNWIDWNGSIAVTVLDEGEWRGKGNWRGGGWGHVNRAYLRGVACRRRQACRLHW